MNKKTEDHTTEANMELNREFYGEETEPTRRIKNGLPGEAENANMQIDRVFNEGDHEFDLLNSTSIRRGNG